MPSRRLVLTGLLFAVALVATALLALRTAQRQRVPLTPTFGAVTGDNPLVETREIMFTSNRDGDWDIYVLALADGTVTNLTDNDADDGFGSYSADGAAITFLSNRDGELDAYMMNADGSDQRRVANDLGTIVSVVTSGRLDWDFVPFSSDRTAFVSLRDLNLEVYVRDANGDHNLSRNSAVDWFPAWSPHGDRVAFASDRDGNQEIYVVDADGANIRRLTDALGDDLYPMWSGNTLVFMSDRDTLFEGGQIGLYALNLDDPDPTPQRITASSELPSYLERQIWTGRAAPSGVNLYVSGEDGDWEIYLADGVGRHTRKLTDNDADDLFPVWRPQP